MLVKYEGLIAQDFLLLFLRAFCYKNQKINFGCEEFFVNVKMPSTCKHHLYDEAGWADMEVRREAFRVTQPVLMDTGHRSLTSCWAFCLSLCPMHIVLRDMSCGQAPSWVVCLLKALLLQSHL